MNLPQQGGFARVPTDWDLLFSAVLWNIWKQRNDRVFNGVTEEWGSVVTRSRWLAASSAAAATNLRYQQVRALGTGAAVSPINWCPPDAGWVKLNTDGARFSVDGRASCGGVLRDHNGVWIRGFTRFRVLLRAWIWPGSWGTVS
ncbi:hypothetical protein V6N12_003523 [Hibiscus sabdariffa]|uniref:RNase H type-1 domain-containing protein n=1 Tax=Hibiscus sabdariffa TaxID=183260 RepID=A0ABR2ARE3_9ROSI